MVINFSIDISNVASSQLTNRELNIGIYWRFMFILNLFPIIFLLVCPGSSLSRNGCLSLLTNWNNKREAYQTSWFTFGSIARSLIWRSWVTFWYFVRTGDSRSTRCTLLVLAEGGTIYESNSTKGAVTLNSPLFSFRITYRNLIFSIVVFYLLMSYSYSETRPSILFLP